MIKEIVINRTAILVFLILLYVGCWGLIYKGVLMILMFFSTILPCYYIFATNKKTNTAKFENRFIMLFIFAILMNLLSCSINRGQTILESLSNTELLWFLFIMSFYVYYRIGFSISEIEDAISILFLVFCISYIAQYYIFYPKDVFYQLALIEDEHRFRLVGQFISFIGYFYALNNVVLRKINYKSVSFLILGLWVILLMGFRSGLVAVIFSSILMIFRIRGVSAKTFIYLIVIGTLFFSILYSSVGNTILGNMISRTESNTSNSENYIRVRQFAYYTQDHFRNNSECFFGTGIPSANSEYGKYMESLTDKGNVTSVAQWRDWGLLGLSWIMGIPMFACMLFLIFYMIFKKTPPRYYYISSVYISMLLMGITTVEVYRNGAFVFHGLLLYLLFLVKRRVEYNKIIVLFALLKLRRELNCNFDCSQKYSKKTI